MSGLRRGAALALTLALICSPSSHASDRYLTLASTTSTENSGLLDFLLARFREASGVEVRVVIAGTGQALRIGRNGDADVLLVHHRESEEAFVAAGYGESRHDVMFNDFVIVGPAADPAGLRGTEGARAALARVAAAHAVFVSRGDNSGTHKKEVDLWRAAGVDPTHSSGAWYRETGSGMGATLNAASALDGYALADRGTWLRFRNKGTLEILVEGDALLFNPYGVILINPERHPHVKAALGRSFIAWLLSTDGQREIAQFRIDGKQAFFPVLLAPRAGVMPPERATP